MCLLNILLFNLRKSLGRVKGWGKDEDLVFVKEKTKDQGEVIGPRPHSWRKGFEPQTLPQS